MQEPPKHQKKWREAPAFLTHNDTILSRRISEWCRSGAAVLHNHLVLHVRQAKSNSLETKANNLTWNPTTRESHARKVWSESTLQGRTMQYMKPTKANPSKSTPPPPILLRPHRPNPRQSIHTNNKHSNPSRSHPFCVFHSRTIRSTPILSNYSNLRLSTPIQYIVLRPMQSDCHRPNPPQSMLPRAPQLNVFRSNPISGNYAKQV